MEMCRSFCLDRNRPVRSVRAIGPPAGARFFKTIMSKRCPVLWLMETGGRVSFVAVTSIGWRRYSLMQQIIFNVTLLLALLLLFSTIEAALPFLARPDVARRPANLWLMLCTFSVNAGLTTLVAMAAIWLPAKNEGFLEHSGLPAVAAASITIIILDLVTYGAHVALHKFPWLWRIHRVHHSDRFVDATTAFRQHPFEGLWRFCCQMTAILLLGLPLAVVVVYRLASSVNAVLEHSNISIGRTIDKAVAWVFITPNMHKAHHSHLPYETDSNYGNLLSGWDRMFSTFTPTERAYELEYGLDSVDNMRAGSIRKLLMMPFRKT